MKQHKQDIHLNAQVIGVQPIHEMIEYHRQQKKAQNQHHSKSHNEAKQTRHNRKNRKHTNGRKTTKNRFKRIRQNRPHETKQTHRNQHGKQKHRHHFQTPLLTTSLTMHIIRINLGLSSKNRVQL